MPRRPFMVLVACLALMAAGCQGGTVSTLLTGTEIIVPPGVASSRNSDQVTQLMLAEIAANERQLGRALVPARILRVRLLRAGEAYPLQRLDGTNPSGAAMSPNDGPGWMVEAVGTFLEVNANGQVTAMGTHGFHRYDDAGGEGFGFIPCWTLQPLPATEYEGTCR